MLSDENQGLTGENIHTDGVSTTAPIPRKSIFSRLGRVKVLNISLSVALLLVLSAGAFFTLRNNNFKADESTDPSLRTVRTVTVSGNFTDIFTKVPVAGAKVTVTGTAGPTKVATDINGDYTATVTVPTAVLPPFLIWVKEENDGYPVESLPVKVGASSYMPDVNFGVGAFPTSIISTKLLDPISTKCRTGNGSFGYTHRSFPNTGDYKGQEIKNILFCADEQNARYFDEYAVDLINIADQINYLTTVSNTTPPIIYMRGRVTWDTSAAYASYGNEIVINVESITDLAVITHEMGHIVDWQKGSDYPDQISAGSCVRYTAQPLYHCYRSDEDDFIESYRWMISNLEKGFIKGYAEQNQHEMFAELFAALYTPDTMSNSQFSYREKLKYAIANRAMGEYQSPLNPNQVSEIFASAINPSANDTQLIQQNSAMYMYKVVAAAGNIGQFFPGRIDTAYDYDDIMNANFMDKSFASVKMYDELDKPIANAAVTIGGVTEKTLSMRTKDVFPDGRGDLYDSTGTATLSNVPTGTQTVSVKLPSGTELAAGNIVLQTGWNKVLALQIKKKATDYPFLGTSVDANLWSTTPDFSVANEKISVNHVDGTPTSGALSKFKLSGDFDIKVSYSNLVFTEGGSIRAIGLRANGTLLPLNIERRLYPNGTDNVIHSDLYINTPNNPYEWPDTSTAGTLRIQRVGTVGMVYATDGTTVYLTREIGTEDVSIEIYGMNDNYGGGVQADFSGLQVVSSTLEQLQQLPLTVVSLPPSSVDAEGASFDGSVAGGSSGKTILGKGFEYGLTKNGNELLDYSTADVTLGSFGSSVRALKSDTTYYYRAMVKDSQGVAVYGSWMEFKTKPLIERVSFYASPVTNITATSATVNFEILSDGANPADEWIIDYECEKDGVKSVTQRGSYLVGKHSYDLANLSSNAVYSLDITVINAGGMQHDAVGFTTLGLQQPVAFVAPVVETLPPTDITTKSAVPHGEISNTGGAVVTSRGFRWSRANDGSMPIGESRESGEFIAGEFSKLPSIPLAVVNMTYYVQAFAVNSVGTTYGDWVQFKTKALVPPTVVTLPPTDMTTKSAVPHGSISDIGGSPVTRRGFRLTKIAGTAINGAAQAVYYDSGIFEVGDFTKVPSIPLSVPNTTYYIQAYAANTYGTAYGAWIEFKTQALLLPTVVTLLPTEITTKAAVPHGNITDLGNTAVTARGFKWSKVKDGSSATADGRDSGAFGIGEFSKLPSIPLAVPNATYYIRAYAVNTAGIGYGDWVEFKTKALALPSVTTVAPAAVDITARTIVPYGEITSVGDAAVTARGFRWSKVKDAAGVPVVYGKTYDSGTFTVGKYTKLPIITLPTPNTTYYIQAYAVSAVGVTYGEWIEFKTKVN